MTVLLDTNIIIDCLTEREPHFVFSRDVVRKCLDGDVVGFLPTHTANDIFYIVHKSKPDLPPKDLVEAIVMFFKTLETVNLTVSDIEAASLLTFSDFEDALINQCALKIKSDYIITRNVKDFSKSTVKAITPQVFLKQIIKN